MKMKLPKYWQGYVTLPSGKLLRANKYRPARQFYIDHIEQKELHENNS